MWECFIDCGNMHVRWDGNGVAKDIDFYETLILRRAMLLLSESLVLWDVY